jgi:hypothetical protein
VGFDTEKLKELAKEGPVYFMLVVGALTLLGVDPAEAALGHRNGLTASEFITANVVGAALIVIGGVLALTLSRSMLKTLERGSTASSRTAETALNTLRQAAEKLSETDAATQRLFFQAVIQVGNQFGMGPPPSTEENPSGAAQSG